MDSAARNFLTLLSICVVLGAYAVWGFIAYVAVPFIGVSDDAFGRLPLAGALPALILALLLAVSIGLAAKTLRRQITASRRLSRHVQAAALPPTPELRAATERSGLLGRVALVDSDEPFSFTYGFLSPRVAISRDFLESLSEDELQATLEHERYHVRNLDPCRALTTVVLSEAFFLLPSLKVLRARYEVARELAADRRAEQGCGRHPLIGALLKALEGPRRQEPAVGVSLTGSELLAVRLSHLETGRMPALEVASHASLAWSALGAIAFLSMFLSAMIGLGGTSALFRAASYEISASGISLDGLCVAPVAAAAFSYWRVARRACQPLSSIAPRV
jgi:Zn-dependent protease with chaperone function